MELGYGPVPRVEPTLPRVGRWGRLPGHSRGAVGSDLLPAVSPALDGDPGREEDTAQTIRSTLCSRYHFCPGVGGDAAPGSWAPDSP